MSCGGRYSVSHTACVCIGRDGTLNYGFGVNKEMSYFSTPEKDSA